MKKKKIFLLSVIVILILVTFLLLLLNNNGNDKSKRKKFSNSWAEKYFDTLNSFKDLESQKDNYTVYEVHFYDIGEKNPIMVMKSEHDSIKLATIYFINDDNAVSQMPRVVSDVELLYHIDSDKYEYYYNEDFAGFVYHKISDAIHLDSEEIAKLDGIVIKSEGAESVIINGTEKKAENFDDIFVKVDENNKGFSYVVGENEETLKNKILKSEVEYKTIKEVVNNDVKQQTKSKLEKKANNEQNINDESQSNTNNNSSVNDKTDNTEHQTKSNKVDFSGTYYLALTDGSLAKDGSGTIIINSNGSCTYYSGWSDFGCQSYTTNDHVICLKTTESSSNICFNLTVDNKTLIAPNNEKYIRE